jgi:Domain of unknown function (DUF4416)
MSQPQSPNPAKLVMSLLMADKSLGPRITIELEAVFGAIDMVSPWMVFDYTDYYAFEMGKPLHRRMLVFKELIAQSDLARIKLRTNEIEMQYAHRGKRRVNIDPGFLLYERFVLATGKNYSHRIYIGEGIYADLTLVYQKSAYQPLPWTYPDYADAVMGDFLMQVRQKYGEDIKNASRREKPEFKE